MTMSLTLSSKVYQWEDFMPYWDVNFDTIVQVDNREVIRHIEKVYILASVIREIPIPPAVQQRIDALNIMRAVRGTTGIEGTELTEDEVEKIMQASPQKKVLPSSRSRDEQEARNAEQLMYFIADTLSKNRELPLSEQLICKMHGITTQKINYPHNIPGEYRNHPASVETAWHLSGWAVAAIPHAAHQRESEEIRRPHRARRADSES